jgi:hypothetical protein
MVPGMTDSQDGLFDEATPPSNAPPPPPPPPPTGRHKSPESSANAGDPWKTDTDAWIKKTSREIRVNAEVAALASETNAPADLARELARLTSWVERIDRDVQALKSPRVPLEPSSASARFFSGTSDALGHENEELRAEIRRLKGELGLLESQRPDGDLLSEQLAAAQTALELVRTDLKRVTDENERLEGEVQSLKLRETESRDKTRAAVAAVTDLKLEGKVREVVKAIVVDRDKLQEEKGQLESEIARVKVEAAKRITALRGELEKTAKFTETVRIQKDNLLRQLQARDAASGDPREITLEDITGSDIFKQMLGNIRRTSRLEVTTLHDAVMTLRSIDPHAYEVVLEVVAKQFQKAAIENPLATLPRP